jgi:hypothetical protein
MVGATKEELTDALVQHAISLFGKERVEELRPGIEERAEQLWLLSLTPLDRNEEPAVMFFPERLG